MQILARYSLFHSLLIIGFSLSFLVHAQDQSGFISLDSGLTEGSSYTDSTNGINYVTSQFQRFRTVRSFPEGDNNCYKFSLRKGDKYLIRINFFYGNYDGKNIVPQFDVRLGPNFWVTFGSGNYAAGYAYPLDIIHVLQSKYLYVCLVNTGNGVPFISALELRLLQNSMYTTQYQTETLSLVSTRFDVGVSYSTFFRFKEDAYDRMWWSYQRNDWGVINTSLSMDQDNDFKLPPLAMKTAGTPANVDQPMNISIANNRFYLYMHFAELQVLKSNESREFDIYINDRKLYGPFSPKYLQVTTLPSESALSSGVISIQRTSNSTLAPIFNAFEVYDVIEFLQSQTDDKDVDAIANIKSMYGLTRNWQGDPCAPQRFVWEGLNCSYVDYNPPRIISLNLSSSNLNGEISPDIANLSQLQHLDLSQNRLTGPVPEFLANLEFLTILNLSRNTLNGSIPENLMQRANQGQLDLIMDEEDVTPNCVSDSCQSSNNNDSNEKIVPILAVVASVLLVIIIALAAVLWKIKRRKQPVSSVETSTDVVESRKPNQSHGSSKNRQFSHAQVQRMTNNFETVIGKGGFGTVFLGHLDETKVAVKMLSSLSVQGYKEFQAEVQLLLRVHHRNLTALIGYCDDGNNMGLIYEYMPKGNLSEHLKDSSRGVLNWEGRLSIALEAAQGLEYLHNGCVSPIIHRDVKSTNILLTESLHAKLSDFGLSKAFALEGDTHVTTVVAGTPGYLDPEYTTSNRLTENVYSFGVVLLEIITNRPAITKTYNQATHISQWVSFVLSDGDIDTIADSRLQGDFDTTSMKKAVELGIACVSPTSAKRPSMNYVVAELSECLSIEIERIPYNSQSAPIGSNSLA